MQRSLSDGQIEQYRNDGYVVVPGVLEPETLARLRAVTDAVVAGAAGVGEHTEILDLEPGHTPEAPRVRRIKRPHRAHPFFCELARHPRITAVMADLIGPDIRMRDAGKVNVKAAGYGAAVEWHQDWAFYPHTNQDVLAVGILLDDMDEDNGPLLVLPRSHRGPVHDHHGAGAFCGAIDVAAAGLDVSGARRLTARAGSITVHHARLVHGSARNESGRPRRILFYEYAAADAWPLAGVEAIEDLAEFDRRIVLGAPTLAPRLEAVPVRMPLPRARYQGSIYENQRTLARPFFRRDPEPAGPPAAAD